VSKSALHVCVLSCALSLALQAAGQSTDDVVSQWVLVPGGIFDMGDVFGDGELDEKPVHKVKVDSFYISAYEITTSQFARFLNDYGCDTVKTGVFKGRILLREGEWGVKKAKKLWKPAAGYENHPVVNVTWFGANEFCRHYHYRLPTEAEWEYAARSAGKHEKWAGTSVKSEIEEYAWIRTNSAATVHGVGIKKPNGLGLYDMTGNVWEWCQDWFGAYTRNPNLEHKPPSSGDDRVVRGGSWNLSFKFNRTTVRARNVPNGWNNYCGFRVIRMAGKME